MFQGKRVLITGGTGSFGRALVAKLQEMECKEIRIFSRDELKQEMMRIEFNDSRLKFYIGDVRSLDSVTTSMRGIDFVFHAAALKQVPSCDFFPMQAVYTNVIGSHHVLDAAFQQNVKKIVCLSTDKAVYPINAMGMTKGLMEKVAHAAARTIRNDCTVINIVRYGNVMYSRGSVIPLFVKQILDKSPLTITEPAMTRFLLPLQNAVDLVLYAFEFGRQGDTFVRKAPACTIGDLALALISLFGTDTVLNSIGIRHGEKIFETLVSREELISAEDLGAYFRIPLDSRDLNYNKYFTEGDLMEKTMKDYTSDNADRLNIQQIKDLLLTLPEIQMALSSCNSAKS